MICWKVSHKYKLIDHIERKDIGIYSSLENAEKAVASLKAKSGFKDTADGFRITKVFTLFTPRLLDNTHISALLSKNAKGRPTPGESAAIFLSQILYYTERLLSNEFCSKARLFTKCLQKTSF